MENNEKQRELFKKLNEKITVREIQKYVKEIIGLRGFSNKTYKDEMLLMIEEVGELAKAVRKRDLSSTIDKEKLNHYTEIEEEIADVFIVLVEICNVLNIDLLNCVIEKESINIKRKWSKNDE